MIMTATVNNICIVRIMSLLSNEKYNCNQSGGMSQVFLENMIGIIYGAGKGFREEILFRF
jgi:hypothetical protein